MEKESIKRTFAHFRNLHKHSHFRYNGVLFLKISHNIARSLQKINGVSEHDTLYLYNPVVAIPAYRAATFLSKTEIIC